MGCIEVSGVQKNITEAMGHMTSQDAGTHFPASLHFVWPLWNDGQVLLIVFGQAGSFFVG